MQRDEAVVVDILKAARWAIDFVGQASKDEFTDDFKTQSAVIHQLMIVGEAVKRLSTDFRARYSEVPWGRIAGMRDMLIHQYDDVDLDEVWKTVTFDIPRLVTTLEPLEPKQ